VIHNQVFNVGHNNDNYRVREIAEIVGGVFSDSNITMGPSGGDHRSYRVSFDKIHRQLPGFMCGWDAKSGAKQLKEIFERTEMTRERFEFRAFTRLKQLEFLIRTRQLDDSFFWRF
jgi:hypothetical protein